MKWKKDNFILYDEHDKADAEAVHSMLVNTHWAKGRSLQTVRDTIKRCLCFSLYDETSQIGFTRILTDYATYAIILDVVIEDRYRERGLGKWMMECLKFGLSNRPIARFSGSKTSIEAEKYNTQYQKMIRRLLNIRLTSPGNP